MHENKVLQNISLIYIKNFFLYIKFFSVWKFIFTKDNANDMLLLTVDFL